MWEACAHNGLPELQRSTAVDIPEAPATTEPVQYLPYAVYPVAAVSVVENTQPQLNVVFVFCEVDQPRPKRLIGSDIGLELQLLRFQTQTLPLAVANGRVLGSQAFLLQNTFFLFCDILVRFRKSFGALLYGLMRRNLWVAQESLIQVVPYCGLVH